MMHCLLATTSFLLPVPSVIVQERGAARPALVETAAAQVATTRILGASIADNGAVVVWSEAA